VADTDLVIAPNGPPPQSRTPITPCGLLLVFCSRMPQRPLAASANLGDNDVLDMESWVAKGQLDHLDIVVFGLQESKYFKAPSGN